MGDSNAGQGDTKPPTKSTPAVVNITTQNNQFPLTITDSNNVLKIKVNNGEEKTITIDKGEYASISKLAENLQKKLDAEYGKSFGGITVTSSSNSTSSTLTLTANIKNANGVLQDGKKTRIECSTADSSFLYGLNTTRTPASVQLNKTLKNSITLNNDTFSFSFKKPGDSTAQTITATNLTGTYSAQQFCNELNKQLESKGVKATVAGSYSSQYLVLTATTPGEGYEISYDLTNIGTCAEKVFNNVNASPKPASTTLDRAIPEKFTPETGKENFTFYINNQPKTVKLTPNQEYTREKFLKAINDQFGSEVTATLNSSNQLVLTTKATGTSTTIRVSYDSSSTSAMPAIFGKTPVDHNGVKADFTNDGKLKLTVINKDGKTVTNNTVTVSSKTGSIFQTGKIPEKKVNAATSPTGYHSKIYSSINGAPLQGNSVTIDKWNKDLNFYYCYNPYGMYSSSYNTKRTFLSVSLEEKTYSFSELQTALQQKLDDAAGQGVMNVQVDSNGVKIMMGTPGNKYFFSSGSYSSGGKTYPSGGFYYNVLRRSPEKKVETKPEVQNGYYDATVYSMGRQDVRNNGAEITQGINDTLTMDFTYGNTVVPITLKITPGTYSGSGLVKELQDKLNEQLVANNLPKNLIEVGLGAEGITLPKDLVGYNNDSLLFRLSKTIKLPQENVEYKIDGVGGNAAFSIFYQTDGDMRIAYSRGTKNITGGVTIPEDSTLSFDVDGVNYEVEVAQGEYSSDEILQMLNDTFKDKDVPVTAHIEKGNLQLMHTKYGKHQITNVNGNARRYLFFEENGEKDADRDIWIRLSGVDGDGITIERPVVNTVSLGINSITISKTKYGEKALSRLKSATVEVSSIRMMFGTMQNRLEHKVSSNDNAAENTQAAESLIRDADISKEVLEESVNRILEQVAHSMLAQANSQHDMVLRLLQ
ncbi:MAG: hypothetical protein NC321_13555 [Clostridium sp.]|nr:hypothetical protein [Clostridium sp.]